MSIDNRCWCQRLRHPSSNEKKQALPLIGRGYRLGRARTLSLAFFTYCKISREHDRKTNMRKSNIAGIVARRNGVTVY